MEVSARRPRWRLSARVMPRSPGRIPARALPPASPRSELRLLQRLHRDVRHAVLAGAHQLAHAPEAKVGLGQPKPSRSCVSRFRRSRAGLDASSESSMQWALPAPRPTRPRNWWSCARPKRSAPSSSSRWRWHVDAHSTTAVAPAPGSCPRRTRSSPASLSFDRPCTSPCGDPGTRPCAAARTRPWQSVQRRPQTLR